MGDIEKKLDCSLDELIKLKKQGQPKKGNRKGPAASQGAKKGAGPKKNAQVGSCGQEGFRGFMISSIVDLTH